jgi:hypothetical protein
MFHEIPKHILQVTFTKTVSYLGIRMSTNLMSMFHHVIHTYTYMNARLSYSWKEVLQNIKFV